VLSYFKDDALGMSELALVNREALWQLQAIMNDCLRRWPTLGQGGSTLEVAVAEWCEACAQLMPQAGRSSAMNVDTQSLN
jgi:thiol-disulfide isomerase/thioredoxin